MPTTTRGAAQSTKSETNNNCRTRAAEKRSFQKRQPFGFRVATLARSFLTCFPSAARRSSTPAFIAYPTRLALLAACISQVGQASRLYLTSPLLLKVSLLLRHRGHSSRLYQPSVASSVIASLQQTTPWQRHTVHIAQLHITKPQADICPFSSQADLHLYAGRPSLAPFPSPHLRAVRSLSLVPSGTGTLLPHARAIRADRSALTLSTRTQDSQDITRVVRARMSLQPVRSSYSTVTLGAPPSVLQLRLPPLQQAMDIGNLLNNKSPQRNSRNHAAAQQFAGYQFGPNGYHSHASSISDANFDARSNASSEYMSQFSPQAIRPSGLSPAIGGYADPTQYQAQLAGSETSSNSQLPYDPIDDTRSRAAAAAAAAQQNAMAQVGQRDVSGVDSADLPKAFACSTCAKGFARRSDLVRHGTERLHILSKDHLC